jgi:tRNA(Ile)-lysidine synthase
MSQSLLHLSDKLVAKALLSYVSAFGDAHKLWPNKSNQKSFIALSGGADSMLLAFCVTEILKQKNMAPPIALHVNYGTRKESDNEQELCESFCREMNLEMHTLKLSGVSLNQRNFEKEARDIRYDFFKEFLREDDLLYMGHHLDDCFEWSLLMTLKSSGLKARLGTPIRNNHIRRPFHCLSKEQILNLCQKLGIDYGHDSSNDSLKFERNRMRRVVGSLKTSYPNLLKNYVNQQQELLSLYQNKQKLSFELSRCKFGGAILKIENIKEANPSELLNILSDFIRKYSNKTRGKLRDQLNALIEGQKKSKMGPYAFSGDVLIYPLPNGFYILNRDIQKLWDQDILNTQIPSFQHPIIKLVSLDSARNIHPLIAVIKNEIVGENCGWAYNL